MNRQPVQALAHLAAFDAAGDVSALWVVGPDPVDLVLRDGYLMPRSPGEVLPQDAPIARIEFRPTGRPGETAPAIEGANLLLGGRRLRPGRPEILADGDTLVVDHRDIGQPPSGAAWGLLVRFREAVAARPFRWFTEMRPGAVDVERPVAGRALGAAGIAVAVFGALPAAAAALARPAGSASRDALVLGAVGLGLAGSLALATSRLLRVSGTRLEWDDGMLARTATGGLRGRSDRWPAADADGITVRLGADRGRWVLAPMLRTRAAEIALDTGGHLDVPGGANLPAVAVLEARRLDWVELGARLAAAWGRSVDAFVTVQVDRGWPPERARTAVAAGRISVP